MILGNKGTSTGTTPIVRDYLTTTITLSITLTGWDVK